MFCSKIHSTILRYFTRFYTKRGGRAGDGRTGELANLAATRARFNHRSERSDFPRCPAEVKASRIAANGGFIAGSADIARTQRNGTIFHREKKPLPRARGSPQVRLISRPSGFRSPRKSDATRRDTLRRVKRVSAFPSLMCTLPPPPPYCIGSCQSCLVRASLRHGTCPTGTIFIP